MIMSTMQKYFEYHESLCICGFPYIVLEGVLNDWDSLLNKLENLRKYSFDFYIDKVSWIIKKIIDTKKGNVDKNFWLSLFKMHKIEVEKYYHNPCLPSSLESFKKYKTIKSYIDGWFLDFYTDDECEFYGSINVKYINDVEIIEKTKCPLIIHDHEEAKTY